MTSHPLKGLRLVVSGFELEQGEHRGIAVFTKNLLRTLKQSGAEVWLLTEYSPDTKKLKKAKLPTAVGSTIFSAKVLEELNTTEKTYKKLGLFKKILAKLPFLRSLVLSFARVQWKESATASSAISAVVTASEEVFAADVDLA